ncbi:putative claudin-24 [Polypterus senegalus]
MGPDVCVELLGLFLCIAAGVCTLTTTLLPQWVSLSTDLLPTESYQTGLWETCVVQDMGGTECRAYDSLLGLPLDIKLARILMCTAVSISILSVLVAIPGLTLVKCCNSRRGQRLKKAMRIFGGTLSILSGLLCLVPVSYTAHITLSRFWDDTLPDIMPRGEFGDALFCGWAASFLHIVAGILLASSHLCYEDEFDGKTSASPEMQAMDDTSRGRREYV